MLKTIQILRSICSLIAYGAGAFVIAILVSLVYSYTTNDARGAGAAIVKGLMLGTFGLICLGLSYALRAIEHQLIERTQTRMMQPEQAKLSNYQNVNSKKLVVVAVIIGIVVFLAYSYHKGENKQTSTVFDGMIPCTNMYLALLLRHPDLKGSSPDEIADMLIPQLTHADSAVNDDPERKKQAIMDELFECRWVLAHSRPGEAHFFDPTRMLLFPNNRRYVPILHDFYTTKVLREGEQDHNYSSITAMILIDCDQFGHLYVQYSYMSLWFGIGGEVSQGGVPVPMNAFGTTALRNTTKGSTLRTALEAICAYK